MVCSDAATTAVASTGVAATGVMIGAGTACGVVGGAAEPVTGAGGAAAAGGGHGRNRGRRTRGHRHAPRGHDAVDDRQPVVTCLGAERLDRELRRHVEHALGPRRDADTRDAGAAHRDLEVAANEHAHETGLRVMGPGDEREVGGVAEAARGQPLDDRGRGIGRQCRPQLADHRRRVVARDDEHGARPHSRDPSP